MINVVHGARGTARGINVGITYKVAGKTGTAQVFGIAQDEEYDEEAISLKLRDHALFISSVMRLPRTPVSRLPLLLKTVHMAVLSQHQLPDW